MRHLLSLALTFTCFAILQPTVQAATKTSKANIASKERLVLMPLRVNEENKNLSGALETALVEGLQQGYEVFSGEKVAQKAKAIFLKESRNVTKKECDETRCMQDIAQAFQAELIATASVTRQDGGYFLALNIQNIFDNKIVYAKSVPCDNCNIYQAVEKFKLMSGMSVQAAPTNTGLSNKPDDFEIILWSEAQKGNTVIDYQVYIDGFPNGIFVQFAKARIKQINESVPEKQVKRGGSAFMGQAVGPPVITESHYDEETAFWYDVVRRNDIDFVKAYISNYPRGRFFASALGKLRYFNENASKVPVMLGIPGTNVEMGKFEVTQAEWREVMGNNPSGFSNCGDNCPVESVIQVDILAYIDKLNARTGKRYRLPSAAEWKNACYGGNRTEYCGGNDMNAVAWHENNSNKATHPVGEKQANGYGLYDMSGNVMELIACYSCMEETYLGGSWNSEVKEVRAVGSRTIMPNRVSVYGFRLARTLPYIFQVKK